MKAESVEIKTGHVPFQTQGKLLQELGERLVASSEVALVELVKNAFDADSPQCIISLQKNNTLLVVEDRGHGIDEQEFLLQWMQIATGEKQRLRFSRKYRRKLTGAKGIGRFAVRFLGKRLELDTIAVDRKRSFKTRLKAIFDWASIDRAPVLSKVPIEYHVFTVDDDTPTGTRLTISERRDEGPFEFTKALRAEVLRMTSPLSGLERGKFAASANSAEDDPGFKVILPEPVDAGGKTQQKDVAKELLSNFFIRLTVEVGRGKETYKLFVRGRSSPALTHVRERSSHISNGLFADIRFFPKRAGMFAGTEIDGRVAWSWIRENCGVSVLDHGFRIKPYGFPDNDWLKVDIDTAKNRRDWRSSLMVQEYPIPDTLKNTAQNPMLRLPYTSQLIGAVSVESVAGSRSDTADDLIPAMDREGFIENAGFRELSDIVRAGVELIGLQDQREHQRELEEQAKAATEKAKREFRAAIEHIRSSPTLVQADKDRIIKHYSELSERLKEASDYERRARVGLEVMGLLGVVAGFMTHESDRIIFDLEKVSDVVKKLKERIPELPAITDDLTLSIQNFKGYRDYAATFIDSVHRPVSTAFTAAPQIDRVITRFGSFAADRGIKVVNEVDPDVMAPLIPVAIYSGILLNLYTNAVKAVVAGPSGRAPRILFRGRNDSRVHLIEVLDTGVGIPPELHERVWDPLFTTTSRQNNPLGSGMGLGLSLVRKLVRDFGGDVKLISPATDGFSTCFRIEFPLRGVHRAQANDPAVRG